MAEPEVTFGHVELDDRQRAEVRGVLRRIRSNSATGSWPIDVTHIRVTDVLDGGRSDALVLGIDVHEGNNRLTYVVKVDAPAVLEAEWQAFTRLLQGVGNSYFAPIVAATPDIVDRTAATWGPGAVVYAHAAQFAGSPEQSPRTLEDLVRAAHQGSVALDVVVRLIERLLPGVAHVLYHRYTIVTSPSTLRAMNLTLGPNVVLAVDEPDEQHGDRAWIPDDELLARTLGGPTPRQLVAGEDVALNQVRPDPEQRPGFAHGDNIIVALQPAVTTPARTVRGRVVEVRGAALRSRMLAALAELGPVDPADRGWNVAGTAVADPFGALLDVLTRPSPGRVRSVIHGDLNPRNVLLVDDRPFLIDYSHTADGWQQTDVCWLELGLLRDVFADLGFPALVTLQRLLALASRVLGRIPDVNVVVVASSLVRMLDPDLAVPFRVLLEIRRRAHSLHPSSAGMPWYLDHLEQLLLAAHRTAKWTTSVQTAARMRATAAVASVATEHLGANNGFDRWADTELSAALVALEPVLPFSDDDAIRLLHQLTTAMSSVDGPAETTLVAARERLVRTRCADWARAVLAEREGESEYVDLAADQPSSQDVADDVFSVIAAEPSVLVSGASGSGKTTLLREVARRLAVTILDTPDPGIADAARLPVRVPVLVDATHLARLLTDEHNLAAVACDVLAKSGLADLVPAAFEWGAPHLLVDNLDRLDSDGRRSVLGWLSALRSRYGRVHIVVCQRQPAGPAECGLVTLRLRDLDVAGMRVLLRGALAGTSIRGTAVERLLRAILTEPEWLRLHPERPGVLAMVARHVRRSGSLDRAITPADIITEQLVGLGAADGPRVDALTLVCERLAVRLIDERGDDAPDISDPDGLFAELVDRGVLHRHDGRIGFADQVHVDYFAAGALRRALPSVPVELVRRPDWHSALRVFVTLPGVVEDPAVVLPLVHAAGDAALELAAHLIGDARIDDEQVIAPFVETCRAVLADDGVPHDTAAAAAALAALPGPAGLHALRSTVADDEYVVAARVAALRAVAVRGRRAMTGNHWFAEDVARLLAAPCPVPLRVAALEVIATDGLRGVELFVGRCVAPNEPWPVVRAAVRALGALGTALPGSYTDAWQAACLRRLVELDQVLDGPIPFEQAMDHLVERAELLGSLTGPDALATLLAHRFDFQAGSAVVSGLDHLIRLGQAPEPRPAYWHIVAGDPAPDEWVAVIVGGGPLEAAAAAHRLLRDAPDHAVHALVGLDASAPAHRVLLAAAMVSASGVDGLGHAERLFGDLLPTVDGDRLRGAAALLCAIAAVRQESAIRLAWPAADVLAERNVPERHRWPWVTALTRCRGGAAELSTLIEAGAETAAIAESALASRDFPRHGHTGPHLRLSAVARQRMLDRAPGEGSTEWESARWALAVANLDLVEALPALRAVAMRMVGSPTTVRIGTSHSGPVDRAPFADILVALGWLARTALELQATTVHVTRETDEIHQFISDVDIRDSHPSIRTARVVALAYLGDCMPLFRAIEADPSLEQLGLTVVADWAPRPYTPQSLRTDVDLARLLAGLRDEPGLPTAARDVLTVLARAAELRSGVLFPRTRSTDSRPSGPETSGKHP